MRTDANTTRNFRTTRRVHREVNIYDAGEGIGCLRHLVEPEPEAMFVVRGWQTEAPSPGDPAH